MIDADFAIMHKSRPAHDEVAVTEMTGRVRGKIAILGDDVIMTGGTMLANVGRSRAGRERGVAVRDARRLLRRRARAASTKPDHQGHRRHRHGADRPARRSPTT